MNIQAIGFRPKVILTPELDSVEKILLLIAPKETQAFEIETQETFLGLKLLETLLQEMDAIQAQ
jgi:hypothetical protein